MEKSMNEISRKLKIESYKGKVTDNIINCKFIYEYLNYL